jgi:hypothetical protein
LRLNQADIEVGESDLDCFYSIIGGDPNWVCRSKVLHAVSSVKVQVTQCTGGIRHCFASAVNMRTFIEQLCKTLESLVSIWSRRRSAPLLNC